MYECVLQNFQVTCLQELYIYDVFTNVENNEIFVKDITN